MIEPVLGKEEALGFFRIRVSAPRERHDIAAHVTQETRHRSRERVEPTEITDHDAPMLERARRVAVDTGEDRVASLKCADGNIDAEAARLVLTALGAKLDTLTEAQQAYRDSWRLGS